METQSKSIDPLYKVFFEDESIFEGGTFKAPKWNKCPDKGIKRIELILPNKTDKIILENYSKYNFYIGVGRPLTGTTVLLGHMHGLGCKDGIVTSYRVTLISSVGNKYRVGDITVRNFPFGKEGVGRTSTSGWKDGII